MRVNSEKNIVEIMAFDARRAAGYLEVKAAQKATVDVWDATFRAYGSSGNTAHLAATAAQNMAVAEILLRHKRERK